MVWMRTVPRPDEYELIDETLKAWEGLGGIGTGMQSGDVAWMLRDGRETLCSSLSVWRADDGEIGAISLLEGGGIWLQIAPSLLLDRELAGAIADDVDREGWSEVSCAASPSAIRTTLAYRGFAIAPAPWLHLWKPLTVADRIPLDRVISTSTEELIVERIAVQRSAFAGSTFTREKWQAMADGPSFRRELDLLALNDVGRGVSALTAWLPAAGTCAVIEPMGTHQDFQRQGHGRRLLHATFSVLSELGASSVRVFSVPGNTAAEAAYQAAGFRIIGLDTTMVRQG